MKKRRSKNPSKIKYVIVSFKDTPDDVRIMKLIDIIKTDKSKYYRKQPVDYVLKFDYSDKTHIVNEEDIDTLLGPFNSWNEAFDILGFL